MQLLAITFVLASFNILIIDADECQCPTPTCHITYPGKSKTKVAFSAMCTSDLINGNAAVDLTFQKTLTNLGRGFDDVSSFRAPVDGTYFFTFTIHTGVRTARVYLRTNAGYVNEAYGTPGGQTSTNQAILRLQKGDRVWLQQQPNGSTVSGVGHIHVSFNGFLLYED
ncbi:complement C1q tumor necrosis factor-related protein 3-like isoform X2 [Lingula anatina]|uniref:Complement C1q tumor necrosis factor-related protein 3-like isoform X1 n=1 Tax=Lingula anatina TaxID=7574 RepID=A0A1S3HMK4_LINAN|nr:complement C1q tumor necrosis factor-related protein 3-like isoform X1 [Lingula anatina]XP_013387304.1 complement C1q tumor necrosis factor-related protein 3-like isoform X2 [Lingula anatina]|eukprot:XP_013387303.1 complement C1q tumor necrosis factor-related protein 3-like isoform X1 [Lingula anatina]